MALYPYLVNAGLAAALGAGTNELAIIAILRYILPRKKGEIARRIRDIIATDLISPEKMREKLDEPQVGDLLEKNLDQALEELLARDLPSPNELLHNHLNETDALVKRLGETLLDEFSRRVAEPAFADTVIRPFLEQRWKALRSRTPRSLLTRQAGKLPDFVREWLAGLEKSEALRDSVRRSLDNWLADRIAGATNAAEVISPGLSAAAEELAASQAPVIIRQLTDLLREPGVQNTIVNGIMDSIWRQLRGQGVVGGIKGVVANAIGVREDIVGICRRLPNTLEENFQRPVNRDHLTAALRVAVRKGLGQELHADLRTPEKRGQTVDMLMRGFWREDSFARLGENIGDFIESGLSLTLEETVERLGIGDTSGMVLEEATERCRRVLANPATRELLVAQINEFADGWRTRPLGRLDRFVGPDSRQRLAAVAAREGREMLRQRLGDFAEQAKVWDIVVTSIESYDDRQLENMIQQLARKELRWVTVLGGAIGAVVGLLQMALHDYGVL